MSDPAPPGREFVASVSIPLTHAPLGSGKNERGARVFVRNGGIARGGPGSLYFRTSPTFETGAPDLQWLMQHLFIGTGAVAPGGVELRWHELT